MLSAAGVGGGGRGGYQNNVGKRKKQETLEFDNTGADMGHDITMDLNCNHFRKDDNRYVSTSIIIILLC